MTSVDYSKVPIIEKSLHAPPLEEIVEGNFLLIVIIQTPRTKIYVINIIYKILFNDFSVITKATIKFRVCQSVCRGESGPHAVSLQPDIARSDKR